MKRESSVRAIAGQAKTTARPTLLQETTMKKKASKYTTDAKAIKRLEKAVAALHEYFNACPLQSYQRHIAREPLRELKELLREEKRGWVDID
jgi:hypothetical protein